jgi:hypothetical protein
MLAGPVAGQTPSHSGTTIEVASTPETPGPPALWHSFPVVPESGKPPWLQPPVVMRPISGANVASGSGAPSTEEQAKADSHPSFGLITAATGIQPVNAQTAAVGPPRSAEPIPTEIRSTQPALLESLPLLMDRAAAPIEEATTPMAGEGLETSAPPEPVDDQQGVHGSRPAVIFQPAVPVQDAAGHTFLRPSVRLADPFATEVLPPGASGALGAPSIFGDRSLGGRGGGDRGAASLEAMDLQSILISDQAATADWLPPQPARNGRRFWPMQWPALSSLLNGKRLTPRAGYDVGVGRERLPFALFEIDVAQPLNNMRFRFDSAYDWESPDRAEYFWAKAGGRGPKAAEPSLDYQRMGFLWEIASPRFSTSTEIPLIFINPTLVGNTASLGDMAITTKTVLMDGDSLQLTQILRTQLSTGTASLGRGNGHVSMEPGMLARYKWDEDTYMHGELKFWFPLGGDPTFSGQAVRYGFGISKLWYDSDTFAAIPTLEFVGWSLVSGQRTVGQIGDTFVSVPVDGENILNIYPGIRLANDTGGDFGMFECGFSGGLSVTERHWYRGLLRLDLRWSY